MRAVAIGVVLVALFSFFFVYPGHDPKPNHVPLGLVGPGAERTGAALERDGRFEPRYYEDAGEARDAILDREVYG
ncbi:MAG: ABC transporter permease, partial [Actinomycetota bacterium]|nr:ABC transporter permease [Actinomycetota bacterium]